MATTVFLNGIVNDVWKSISMTELDRRLDDWPFLDYRLLVSCLLCYLIFVNWLGPLAMKGRDPFVLRHLMQSYNIFVILFNFYIVWEILLGTIDAEYAPFCQRIDYSNNPKEIRILRAMYLYHLSKYVELLDTIIFILRKKNDQVSTFHVYHHSSVVYLSWIGTIKFGGGSSYFHPLLNSSVHIIMYLYYFLASFGPKVQRYLWWKRYLTIIQVIQIGALTSNFFYVFFSDCTFQGRNFFKLMSLYGCSILYFFLNFYYQAYIKKSKRAKIQ